MLVYLYFGGGLLPYLMNLFAACSQSMESTSMILEQVLGILQLQLKM